MSDFKAKMHQIRFRLGLCPRPAGGAYSAPPDPLGELTALPQTQGLLLREGRERGGEIGEEKGGGKRRGRDGKGEGRYLLTPPDMKS